MLNLKKKISIIIPTKNEQESLPIVLKELKKNSQHIGEIIVVDAMSTDKTTIIAKENNCKIFFQKNKTGYGDAIIKGIQKSKYYYSVIIDGDGSKNPFYINLLLKKIIKSNLDFVFAERYGDNAKSYDDTLITYFGNRLFTILGKIFFNIQINDILHTFFICKNTSFKKIKFKYLDFGFCAELPILVHKKKFKYSQIKSVERKRFGGQVKVRSFIDGIKILYTMIKLFHANFRKNF